MVKFLFPFLAFGILLLTACENEVNLLEDTPPVPIVYGVYNSSLDEQIIAITKTFRFAPGAGALESAATPDSIYFSAEELAVKITNLTKDISVLAERFNAFDEGLVRNDGVFPVNPNIAYRFSTSALRGSVGDEFQLEITRNGEVIAQSNFQQLPNIEFSQTRLPPTIYSLTLDQPFTFRWNPVASSFQDLVKTVEVGFNFAYSETENGVTTEKVIYWPAGKDLAPSSTASIQLTGIFDFLNANLKKSADITRRFRYIQFIVTQGDDSFPELRALVNANRGITSTQELPPYTNVDGAVGLYSSVTQLLQDEGASLAPASFDALHAVDEDLYEVRALNFVP